MMPTIWVTGGTGFLGSHIVQRLSSSGYAITILKRTSSIISRLEGIRGLVSFLDWDRDNLGKHMCANPPEVIIHCATDYGRGPSSRSEIVETNLLLPLKLLDLAIQSGVKAFINTDTFLDKGVSAYSLSKKHFRDWLAASATHIACVNVVLEHFYGSGDDPTKFVTHIVRNLLGDIPEIPLTPGLQYRDFVHIDDVVEAFALIEASAREYSVGFHEFEIGTGTTISIRDFVSLVKELTGNTKTELRFGAIPYRENEVMTATINLTQIRQLGWQPKIDLRTGLANMIQEERRL